MTSRRKQLKPKSLKPNESEGFGKQVEHDGIESAVETVKEEAEDSRDTADWVSESVQNEINAEISEHVSGDKERVSVFCGFCDEAFCDTGQLQRHTLLLHSNMALDSPENNNALSPPVDVNETSNQQVKFPVLRRQQGTALSDTTVSLGSSVPTHSYDCPRCGRSFDAILAMHDHVNICDKQSSPSTNSHQSQRQSTTTPIAIQRPYLCTFCNCSLSDLRAFAEHMRQHHNSASPPSASHRHSGASNTDEAETKSSVIDAYADLKPPVYQCDYCGKTYGEWNGRKLFIEHSMTHYLDETCEYECAGCVHETFAQPDALQKHLLDIHAIPMYRCALCQRCFESKVDIQVHFAMVHSRDTSRLRCQSCHRVFMSREQFKIHLEAVHLSKKRSGENFSTSRTATPLKCSLCFESFAVEFLFERHMQENHPESAYAVRPITASSSSAVDVADDIRPVNSNVCRSPASRFPSSLIHRAAVSRLALTSSPRRRPAPPPPSKCPVCDRQFENVELLGAHKLTHCRVVKCDQCAVCQKRIGSVEEYFNHTTTHHSRGMLRCTICSQSLGDTYELQIHAEFHLNSFQQSPQKSTSDECERVSSCSLQSLPVETEAAVKGRSLTPGELSLGEPSAKRRKPGGKTARFQCIKCQKWFDTEEEIKDHVTSHILQDGLEHHCLLCNKVFSSPVKLQCHLIEHTYAGCREFRCYLCDAIFSMSQPLLQHMLDHSSNEKPFECAFQDCDQKYFFRAELDNHRLTCSHGVTTSGVDIIDRCFRGEQLPDSTTGTVISPSRPVYDSRKPSASARPSGGDDDKPFKCPYCEKSFASHNALQGHSHVHMSRTKAHDKECHLCGKTFINSTKLKNHMRLHTGEKPFSCNLCGRSFTRKDNLKAHARSHGVAYGSTAYDTRGGDLSPLPTMVAQTNEPSPISEFDAHMDAI